MAPAAPAAPRRIPASGLSLFERYLTVWVALCIVGSIVLGKVALDVATFLDGLTLYAGEAPVVSLPIAVCLFFMMYPIMVMYAIALFFLWTLFLGFIGPDAVDYVKPAPLPPIVQGWR